MQFKLTFIAAAILSASTAMAADVTGFFGAGCTGGQTGTGSLGTGCETFGSGSVKSIQYSGVPNSIQFFLSGGQHDTCSGGSTLTLGGGSGCGTAPDGFNWESVLVA